MFALVERGIVACASCRLRRYVIPNFNYLHTTFYRTSAIVPSCSNHYLCTRSATVKYILL